MEIFTKDLKEVEVKTITLKTLLDMHVMSIACQEIRSRGTHRSCDTQFSFSR
jgi:hypothetical protein